MSEPATLEMRFFRRRTEGGGGLGAGEGLPIEGRPLDLAGVPTERLPVDEAFDFSLRFLGRGFGEGAGLGDWRYKGGL